MLILCRKAGEQVRIGSDIVVVIRQVKGDRVRVGIEAPKAVRVLRGELQGCPSPVEQVANPARHP